MLGPGNGSDESKPTESTFRDDVNPCFECSCAPLEDTSLACIYVPPNICGEEMRVRNLINLLTWDHVGIVASGVFPWFNFIYQLHLFLEQMNLTTITRTLITSIEVPLM